VIIFNILNNILIFNIIKRIIYVYAQLCQYNTTTLYDREMDLQYTEDYFKHGFSADEILRLLSCSHGIVLSKRTLEDLEKVQVCLEECAFSDEDVFHICVDLMSDYNLKLTNDVFETVNLYIKLRHLINNELDLDP